MLWLARGHHKSSFWSRDMTIWPKFWHNSSTHFVWHHGTLFPSQFRQQRRLRHCRPRACTCQNTNYRVKWYLWPAMPRSSYLWYQLLKQVLIVHCRLLSWTLLVSLTHHGGLVFYLSTNHIHTCFGTEWVFHSQESSMWKISAWSFPGFCVERDGDAHPSIIYFTIGLASWNRKLILW